MADRDVAARAVSGCRYRARAGGCLAVIPALFLAALLAGPVAAHDWYDGDCCSGHDCAPVSPSAVVVTRDGYAVTLNPGDHPLVTRTIRATVPFASPDARPSQDGNWHACVHPGRAALLCLYVPGAGA